MKELANEISGIGGNVGGEGHVYASDLPVRVLIGRKELGKEILLGQLPSI